MLQSLIHAWLRMQCMMISEVVQGFVVHPCVKGQKPLMAKWPCESTLSEEMKYSAKRALNKRGDHLCQNANKEIILTKSIEFAGQFWGVIVLRMKVRSKDDLRAKCHLLKWGNSWLKLLLQQQQYLGLPENNRDEPEETQTTNSEQHRNDLLGILQIALSLVSIEQSASAVVNELASRFRCNRISLGLIKRQTITLVAVSNSVSFDTRTHAMQLIICAMQEAVDKLMDLHQPPVTNKPNNDGTSAVSQQQLRLEKHISLGKENNQGAVHTLLLRTEDRTVGALTIEENPEHPLENLAFLPQLTPLLTPLFEIKQRASESLLQQSVHSSKNAFKRWFGSSKSLGRYIAASAVLLVVIMLIRAEYWISGEATLESTVKRVVVAPQDGYILSAQVRPGEDVKVGEALAQLDNRELLLEQRRWSSQLRRHEQEYDNALANYDRAKATILSAQVDQATIQLQLIEEQLKRTTLLAPIDGLVVSDDISQALGTPVTQGQVLFEVAPLNSYRVKLYVDEREIYGVEAEQLGRLILSSMPGESFEFTVTSVLPLTEIRNGRNFFLVEGELTESYLRIRPGMTGYGKVLLGKRSLGWLWFHDIVDWLRLKLWF